MPCSGTLAAVDADQIAPVAEDARRRALERLYLRRAAVDDLIRSLEAYQQTTPRRAPCIPINAPRKCS
jgi:hypothetical protein